LANFVVVTKINMTRSREPEDVAVPLPVTWVHGIELRRLPPLHRDPFDRLLVAQARVEGRTLVTADARVRAYDVATMPA